MHDADPDCKSLDTMTGETSMPNNSPIGDDAGRQETRRYVAKWQAIVTIVRTVVVGVCVPGTVAVATFPAQALAGQNTNLTVSITASIALTLSTGAAALWGNQQRKRANQARARIETLEGQIRDLTKERDRLQELPSANPVDGSKPRVTQKKPKS